MPANRPQYEDSRGVIDDDAGGGLAPVPGAPGGGGGMSGGYTAGDFSTDIAPTPGNYEPVSINGAVQGDVVNILFINSSGVAYKIGLRPKGNTQDLAGDLYANGRCELSCVVGNDDQVEIIIGNAAIEVYHGFTLDKSVVEPIEDANSNAVNVGATGTGYQTYTNSGADRTAAGIVLNSSNANRDAAVRHPDMTTELHEDGGSINGFIAPMKNNESFQYYQHVNTSDQRYYVRYYVKAEAFTYTFRNDTIGSVNSDVDLLPIPNNDYAATWIVESQSTNHLGRIRTKGASDDHYDRQQNRTSSQTREGDGSGVCEAKVSSTQVSMWMLGTWKLFVPGSSRRVFVVS